MQQIEIVIGLLAGVAVLAAIAERAGLPHAAVLVLGGLVVGLIPGLPQLHLHPDLVLLGLLPPLVYAAAFRAASYDLRPNLVHILTLATGLVLITIVAVAAAGHALTSLPWVSVLVLGALSAPTDPVSASAVLRGVGAPERVVAILEGESLINDGTGLAAFQVETAAVAGGVSIGGGVLTFVEISIGGCAVGLVVGWLLVRARRRLDEPSLEIVLGLLAAFGSYVAAYAIGWSGVLAAVTAGLYAGSQAEEISSAGARLSMEPFWNALTFVLESVLFLLIGLELPTIVSGLKGNLATGIAHGAVLVGVVLAVRAAWMGALRLGRSVLPTRRDGDPLSGRELTLLGLGGMRGALSLAGALSIPIVVSGHPFAGRDEVIFLVYIIVIGTLVGPSLTLEPLVRRLGLAAGDELLHQEVQAREHIVHAGLARLEELAAESDVPEPTLDRLRAILELRLERLEARRGRIGAEPGAGPDVDAAVRRLRRELIDAERDALADLRRRRQVPTQVLARIQHDIDLDETRLQH
jgi:monovalent cation/hydrogen antiporter